MEREFKILKTLEGHPNIIKATEYVSEKEKCRGYLVMEKVDGKNLLDKVMDDGPFSEAQAKAIIK
jgi:serine/threonine protein kinase